MKECSWWLLVGNIATDNLLAIKRVSFRRKCVKTVNFEIPNF